MFGFSTSKWSSDLSSASSFVTGIGCILMLFDFFFFQAEDGIRDVAVTGVQTCALPILGPAGAAPRHGQRGHRPRGPLPLGRLLPARDERRGAHGRPLPRLQRLACGLLPGDRKSVV